MATEFMKKLLRLLITVVDCVTGLNGLLLLTVTDAQGTVLLSTYQTRLVCAYPICPVPWLKPLP